MGSFFAFTLAAQKTEYDTAHWIEKMSQTGNMVWKFRAPTSEELRRARHYDFGKVRGHVADLGNVSPFATTETARRSKIDAADHRRLANHD